MTTTHLIDGVEKCPACGQEAKEIVVVDEKDCGIASFKRCPKCELEWDEERYDTAYRKQLPRPNLHKCAAYFIGKWRRDDDEFMDGIDEGDLIIAMRRNDENIVLAQYLFSNDK